MSSLEEQLGFGAAAQGAGGVTVLGGVPGLWRCGTSGVVGMGQWLGPILEVFSNLDDSVTPQQQAGMAE